MKEPGNEVTQILESVNAGDRDAMEALFSLIYRELHALAHTAMKKGHAAPLMQTTALIHETYMRLVENSAKSWQNRAHFFGVSATAMRRILVDEARRWQAAKRGGGKKRVPLYECDKADTRGAVKEDPFMDLEALDNALNKLAAMEGSERKCRIVELRFFVGMTLDQTAEVLGISLATVKRDWESARAWLHEQMKGTVCEDG